MNSLLHRRLDALPLEGVPDEALAWLLPIASARMALDRPTHQVAFFGAQSAGKSTLLNALLGAVWVPTRTNQTTGVVIRVTYAPELTATAIRTTVDGRRVTERVPLDAIESTALLTRAAPPVVAARNISAAGSAPAALLELRLGVPAPLLLKLDAEIVDTPGLLAVQALPDYVRTELQRSDLAVWVLAADRPPGPAEREALAEAQALLNGNLVFAVNRLDIVPVMQRHTVREWAAATLAGLGNDLCGGPRVFLLSARDAWSRQSAAAAAMDDLRDWLTTLLTSRGNDLARVARLGVLAQCVAEAHTHAVAQAGNGAQPNRQYYAGMCVWCEEVSAAIAQARMAVLRSYGPSAAQNSPSGVR